MKMVKMSDGSEIVERRNGSSKLIWWMMVTAVGLVVMGGMGWMTHMSTAIAEVQTVIATRGERLSTLEANYSSISTRLTRIEQKVDALLERRP